MDKWYTFLLCLLLKSRKEELITVHSNNWDLWLDFSFILSVIMMLKKYYISIIGDSPVVVYYKWKVYIFCSKI